MELWFDVVAFVLGNYLVIVAADLNSGGSSALIFICTLELIHWKKSGWLALSLFFFGCLFGWDLGSGIWR